MRIARPKTLLSLTLVGLGLVTLPLLLAVGNAMLKLGDLVDESAAVTAASQTSTREVTRVTNALRNMERQARMYLTLDDPGMLDAYATSGDDLRVSLAVLESQSHSTSLEPQFAGLRQTLGEFSDKLGNDRSLPSGKHWQSRKRSLPSSRRLNVWLAIWSTSCAVQWMFNRKSGRKQRG